MLLLRVWCAIILSNAVTSLGENKVIYHPLPHTSFCETQWRHSVKTMLYKNPPPILHCISQLGENKGGRGHWVSQNTWFEKHMIYICNSATHMCLGWWRKVFRYASKNFRTKLTDGSDVDTQVLVVDHVRILYRTYKLKPFYSQFINSITKPCYRYSFLKFVTKNHNLSVVRGFTSWRQPMLLD